MQSLYDQGMTGGEFRRNRLPDIVFGLPGVENCYRQNNPGTLDCKKSPHDNS